MVSGSVPQSVSKLFRYYHLAKEFGWTIPEIDSLPARLLEELLYLLYARSRREERELKMSESKWQTKH
jgi:hypothetical protein